MKMSQARSNALLMDIVNAQHDLVALAQIHDMTPAKLAAWASQPENHNTLVALCRLADAQTQLLVSRYRLLVASRLIGLATKEAEGDTARKACVDLLRMDLKRVEVLLNDQSQDEVLLAAESFWAGFERTTRAARIGQGDDGDAVPVSAADDSHDPGDVS